MKISELLKENKKTRFSFEVLPPLKGKHINDLYSNIEPLIEFNPSFVNVTYHREEYKHRIYNGQVINVPTRKRPGTVAICAAIQYKYDIDAVPHLICGGFDKDETEYALIDLQYLGIDNILALRGDNLKGESHFQPNKDGHSSANELIKQINNMNNGKHLDEEQLNAFPSNFCIGCSGYPEKHSSGSSFDLEIQLLKEKIKNGTEYVITQMFFDNQYYFDFVDRCRENGISIPIIPGIKPLSNLNQLVKIPVAFNVTIPSDLIKEMEKHRDEKSRLIDIGNEWAIYQCKELMAANVPDLHFYTMGKFEQTKTICSSIF